MLEARDFEKFVAGYPDLMMRIWDVARQRMGQPDPEEGSEGGTEETAKEGHIYEDVS